MLPQHMLKYAIYKYFFLYEHDTMYARSFAFY